MVHLNTPSLLRQALDKQKAPANADLESERLDTALRLVLNALDDSSPSITVTVNRHALCRDLATVLRLEPSEPPERTPAGD